MRVRFPKDSRNAGPPNMACRARKLISPTAPKGATFSMCTAPKTRRALQLASFLLTLGLFLETITQINAATQGKPLEQPKDKGAAENALTAKGRAVFGESCIQCHNMNPVLIQRKPEQGWRQTVYSMVSRGAQLTPDEMEALISYLTATYGPDSPLPHLKASAASNAEGSGEESLPAGAGKQILSRACVKCHSLTLVTNSRKSETEWSKTVARMLSIGATLAPPDRQTLTDYLVKNFSEKK